MRGLSRRIAKSKFARDAVWSFAIKIGARGLGFAVTVILARMLGANGYGIYAYALAVVTLMAIPAKVGFPTLLMRETARGLASERPEMIRGVWNWAGKATGVLSLAFGLVGFVVLLIVNDGDLDQQASTLLWGFVLLPFMALGALRGAALQGLGRIVAGQIPEDLVRPALILALVAGLALVTGEVTPPQAMGAHVIAAALAFAVGAWLLLRNTPPSVRVAQPDSEARSWLRASLPLALIAGLATVNAQADILILGVFESPDQIGIFRVAVQVAALAAFGLQAINIVIAPRIARLYTLEEMSSLQRLVTMAARAATGFSVVTTVVFAVAGQQILIFVFGDEFAEAYVPLLIILVGQLVSSTAGSVGHLLNMTGHERDSLNAIAVAATLNVALDFALIPNLGLVGAAIATGTSLAVRNVWLWASVRRRLQINSMAFGRAPGDPRRE